MMKKEYYKDPEDEILIEQEETDDWDNHVGDHIIF